MLVLPHRGDTGGWKDTFSPALPAPSGPYDVGVRRTLLVDRDRRDPWRPDTERTLMLDVRYPADAGSAPLAHYAVASAMTELGSLAWAPTEERRLGLRPDEVNWMFRTASHEWAPPADGSFPVLICSAPPGVMRTAYTGLAEELASRGYVVVTLDHPYDSPVVEIYPTRRVIRSPQATVVVGRAEADSTRIADIGYVVAGLPTLDRELSDVMDQRRLGLFGWVGSDSEHLTRLADLPDVSALAAVAATPAMTGRAPGVPPLLVVDGQQDGQRRDRPRGWLASVTVPGATARSFTDDGAVLAQIAQRYPQTNPVVRRDIGDAQPLAQRTARQALVRFFDIQLRGAPAGTFAMEPGVTLDLVVP